MRQSILIFAFFGVFGAALADGGSAAAPAAQNAPANTPPAASRVCPQNTGSLLPRKPGDCLSSPGRTYGSEELRSTGAVNTGEALRQVDPSLTTSH